MKIVVAFVLFTLYFGEAIAHPTRGNGWPYGKYCLPMPANQQCPTSWVKGYRHHDSEDYSGSGHYNVRSGHIPYLSSFGRDLGWGFCCKTRDTQCGGDSHKSWAKGHYCIFRKGGYCPNGFDEGSILWDDEDSDNGNSVSGTLPDGDYGGNTRIYVCCRNDGSGPLQGLPPLSPRETFILMRYKGSCPSVSGHRGPYSGYLDWDTEDSRNIDEKIGVYPDGETKFGSGIKIEFCTYK